MIYTLGGAKMNKLLIFGGAGSLGTQLVEYYVDKYDIVIASRDEAKHWALVNKFKKPNINTIICDVRDKRRVDEVLLQEKPDIVIIAQALKQVDICEKFPEESINTNIIGVANIANSLKTLTSLNVFKPKAICFVSTDKSCCPINVYGMCKSISEKLMTNISDHFDGSSTKIITVRYGNVLSSKGSIIPLLLGQAKNNNCHKFTLTHEDMTRFMMTLSEAVQLIDMAILYGDNGDLWVPKLKSMKIVDLMKIFSAKFNKPYEITGIRPGEKIHELMLSLEEAVRVNIKNNSFVLNKRNKFIGALSKEYSSGECPLTYDELTVFIDNYLLNNPE
jgi:UDP-glucose 4-epimerase